MFTIPIRRDLTQFIFSEKNYFDATWCIIGTSKYLAKKKSIIVRNTNLVWWLLDCLFCLSKVLLLLFPWWLSPPLLPTIPSTTGSTPGIARNFTHHYPIISLPVTLRTTNAEWKNSDFRGESSLNLACFFSNEFFGFSH